MLVVLMNGSSYSNRVVHKSPLGDEVAQVGQRAARVA